MKKCPSCNTKNENDAAFCAACGASLKDVPTQADELAAAAGDFLSKAKEAAAIGAKKAKEAAQAGAEKAREAAQAGAEKAQQARDNREKRAAEASSVSQGSAPASASSILVDPTEQIIATIGSGYLQNWLSGGGVRKGVGILTPKRFYYKGQNFAGKGKEMTSATEEGIVSIEDITFTMFTHVRHIGLLILAAVFLLICLLSYSMPYQVGEKVFISSLIAIAVLVVTFFIKRQTVFQVSFPGGSFGFDVRYYPIADFRDFQRQLHLLKDHRKEEV